MATTQWLSSYRRRRQARHQQEEGQAQDQASQVSRCGGLLLLALAAATSPIGCRTSSPAPPVYEEKVRAHASLPQPQQHLSKYRESPEIAPVEMTAAANNELAGNHAEPDVFPVSFDSDALATQAPAGLLEAPLEEIQPEPLSMQDVLTAVQSSYPLLTSAYLGRDVALGENVTAWGDFDVKLKGESVSKPENFYKNYHNKLSVEKPLMAGGYLYGGYRVGRGYFPPWYGDEETNDGGEFAAGVGVPLLKGRAIDQRRSELFQAELERRRVEPEIRVQLIEFCRVASIYYWDWVAAGMSRQAQQELLSLAEQRVSSIQKRIELGDLKQITRITNEQLIASRETKLIEAERKLQSAAIKLSLFFRDPIGEPLLPHDSLLPGDFPPTHLPSVEELDAAPSQAIAASPMLAELEWKARQLRVELDYAENSILPKLDAQLYASKDVGGPANVDRTKSPFELELGLYGEVPLQRRAALGKITSTEAKLQQLNAKRQFTTDKTVATVQDAISALQNAKERIYRAEQNVSLAEEALALARIQFNAGDIDVVELNIFEQSATDAKLTDISSKADFFKAVADYRAALNITP